MNISPEEAQASLEAIQQTREQMRKGYGVNGYFLIIWGLAWFGGFLANQFASTTVIGWTWGVLVTAGWILSAFLGISQGVKVRSSIGPRIGFFYLALFGFATLWFIILLPFSEKQGALFLTTIIMFGGVVVGILARTASTIAGSLSVAVLAVAGYYLLPAYFYLWVAVCCGLTMVGIGLYIRLRWR